MAGLYEATRGWDLLAGDAAPRSIPASNAMRLKPVAIAAVAATLLLLATRLRFDVSTNIHHLNLALGDAGLPQFAPDRVYRDLHRVFFLVCPADRGCFTEPHLHAGFLAAWVLLVFAWCFAALRIVMRLALTDAVGVAVAALLIGVSWLHSGAAFVSGANLFGDPFGATQVATVLVVLSLALAMDGSLATAVGLLGVAFDAQAAVALYGVAGLAGASVVLARDGAPVGRAWLTGGACALALAMPGAMWWAGHFAAGGGAAADGMGHLALGQPDQSPVWSVPLANWVLFGCTSVLGLAAFSVLGSAAGVACGAFIGCLAVFALGCGLSLLPDEVGKPVVAAVDQWLPILRPMQVDAVLQVLAAAAAFAVVLRDLRGGGGVLRVMLSVLIAACLLLHVALLPLVALAMLTRAAAAHGELLGLERRIRDCNQVVLCRVAMAAVVLAALAGGTLRVLLPM